MVRPESSRSDNGGIATLARLDCVLVACRLRLLKFLRVAPRSCGVVVDNDLGNGC